MVTNDRFSLAIDGSFKALLSQSIQKEYNQLVRVIAQVPAQCRLFKTIEGTGGQVSVADLIAYQIGWSKLVVGWYESGIKGEMPAMPGEGFFIWDYIGLAKHFYHQYLYDSLHQQDQEFYRMVQRILDIVEYENQTGHLDQAGVWSWCTLASGKQWPLSKWIKVNTSSPYKKAATLIKKQMKKYLID